MLSFLCGPQITSSATPVACIEVSVAAKPFQSVYTVDRVPISIGGVRTHDHPRRMQQAQSCKPFCHSIILTEQCISK